MSELLPYGIKFEAVDYCDTRYSNQLPSRSLWLSVRGDEWMCFFFSFKHESKISSIAEWTKCMCRKGGLPHSSGTGKAVGALGAPCSCPDRRLSPRGLQRGTPLPLQMSQKHERARECGRKLRGESVAVL